MPAASLRIFRRAGVPTALLLLAMAPARAELTQCDGGGAKGSGAGKISTVPYTITAPGVYCLTQKISSNLASGAAITINANNVVLDMNDFAIGNLAAGSATTATGILAIDRQNIVVRNGILRGFFEGVTLAHGFEFPPATTALAAGHSVENITTDTSYALGILVDGRGASVRNNTVLNTQGSASSRYSVGIELDYADGALVEKNSVLNTDCSNACGAGSYAYGIYVGSSSGSRIRQNRVMNTATPVATNSIGIELAYYNTSATTYAPSVNALVMQNVMSNWQYGVNFDPGCGGDYALNGALGVTQPFGNGGTEIAGGGTNF
jgi:hypothetical protein